MVSLMTVASLLSGSTMAAGFTHGQVAALVIAMSAESVSYSHVNDSEFWLINRFFGLTVKQTLATWTVIQGMMGVLGFMVALALYGLVGAIGI